MAINLQATRQIVLFELDGTHPHILSRFHRAVSQAIGMMSISAEEYEQVIGSYKDEISVAHCMSQRAFNELEAKIRVYIAEQEAVYHYDFDRHDLISSRWDGSADKRVYQLESWCTSHALSEKRPAHLPGWTYFPQSKTYLVLGGE